MTKTANQHRKGLSHEERAVQVEALNAQLAQAVEALTTSDGWMRMLAASAKFHRYSPNNVLMLAIQAYERGTEITRVAGFRRWLELGRCVTKGEKGYIVIAPVRRRLSREEAVQAAARGERAYDSEGQPALVIRGFKAEHVFDIAQTSVVHPEKWIDEPDMPQLTGSAPARESGASSPLSSMPKVSPSIATTPHPKTDRPMAGPGTAITRCGSVQTSTRPRRAGSHCTKSRTFAATTRVARSPGPRKRLKPTRSRGSQAR